MLRNHEIHSPFSREDITVSYNVGMILLRKFPICLSDLLSFGTSRHFEDFVGITGETEMVCVDCKRANVKMVSISERSTRAWRTTHRMNRGTYTISPDAVENGFMRKLVSSVSLLCWARVDANRVEKTFCSCEEKDPICFPDCHSAREEV